MSEHFVEEAGVSRAWGRALLTVAKRGRRELAPLTVAITCPPGHESPLSEDVAIRRELERLLASTSRRSVDTVASTLFPQSLWNPQRPRQMLFDRYRKILNRVRQTPQNKHGVYFERMINNGPHGKANQLDFALTTYSERKGVRRSVLQIGIFDPRQDHSTAAMRGFPCLQHISFVPNRRGNLSVNAFYATQYMLGRAYGNYLGIGRLGHFVAHELDLHLTRITCHIGLAELDASKRELLPVIDAIHEAL